MPDRLRVDLFSQRKNLNLFGNNLDLFDLRSHPNFDLWSQIVTCLIAKNPANFRMTKIKAHKPHTEATGAEDNWSITGNEKADELAKQALFLSKLQHDRPLWSASDERKLIQGAKMCTDLLSRITRKAMSIRKTQETNQAEHGQQEREEDTPVEGPLFPRPVPRPWIFPNSIWDPNWLILLCHYFNELRWPPDDHPHPGKVSLLELVLDLFISFQTPGPLNVRTLGNRFLQDVPDHARKSKYAYYYLPTPSQSQGLPGQLLTHASHTCLRSFDFLYSIGANTVPRTNLYCLGMWGYNNVVPALNCRPPLLAGNLVSELLGSTLKPGVRSLRYTLRIPLHPPRPYPPELRAWSV